MRPQIAANFLPPFLSQFAFNLYLPCFLYFYFLLRGICLLTPLDPRGWWGRESCLQALRCSDHQRTPTFSKHAGQSPVGRVSISWVMGWTVGLRTTGPEQLSDVSVRMTPWGPVHTGPRGSPRRGLIR